jgi:hypothetical protein
MLKDVDDKPIEPARKKAERRWRNYDVTKRTKEEAQEEAPKTKELNEPEIAETFSNEGPDNRGTLIRAQTKFAKDIRMMLDGHTKRNLYYHLYALKIQKKNEYRRLLMAKLKLLEARVARQGSSE